MRRRRGQAEERGRWLPLVNLVSIVAPLTIGGGALVQRTLADPAAIPGLCDRVDLEGCPEPEAAPVAPSLQLTVAITSKGFVVASAFGVLAEERVAAEGASLPCADGSCSGPADYPYAELVRILEMVQADMPEVRRITLSPAGNVPYEVVVRTMDAAQGEGGFEQVVVSRGLL
ncbi:MAG: hypothetical protein H6739_41235 [Alphaproteobacteria bacterium]|nr:hypothetical protein [Alphaproteobacteria bacterium]